MLRFIKADEPINNFGCYTTDSALSEKMRILFNSITKRTADLNYRYNLSPATSGGSGLIFHWAWEHIYDTSAAPVKPSLYIHGSDLSFSTNNLANPRIIDEYDYVARNNNAAPEQNIIFIQFIKRGQDFGNAIHERHPDQHILAAETILTKDRYHKCSVFRGKGKRVIIITNKFDPTWHYKLFALLPLFFQDFEHLTKDEYPDTQTILKAFFDNQPELLIPLLEKDYTNIVQKEKEALLNKFYTQLNKTQNKAIIQTEVEVSNTQNALANAENQVYNLLNILREKQYRLLGLKTNPPVADTSILDFLKRSTAISIQDCSNTHVYWNVKTPISNYNKKDVEMYYKHPDQQNSINYPDWFGTLIYMTFVEEKYRLWTNTTVIMPWSGDTGNWSRDGDREERFGNPHITNYNCISTTKSAVAKALVKQDMIAVCSLIISACATITFTDTAVTSKMASALRGYACNFKLFEEVATGKMLSAREIKETVIEIAVKKTVNPEPKPTPNPEPTTDPGLTTPTAAETPWEDGEDDYDDDYDENDDE